MVTMITVPGGDRMCFNEDCYPCYCAEEKLCKRLGCLGHKLSGPMVEWLQGIASLRDSFVKEQTSILRTPHQQDLRSANFKH